MFLLGFIAGFISAAAIIFMLAFRIKRKQEDMASRLVTRFFKERFESGEWQNELDKYVEERKTQIEFNALEKLVTAMEQSQRTGDIVEFEVAGTDARIYVSPPPGTKTEKPN